MPVRAVLFDVGGVLSADMIDTKLRGLAERYGPGVYEAAALRNERADLGLIDDEEFWRAAVRSAGGTPTPEDVEIDRYLVPVPGTLGIAERLKARGTRVGILSNDSRQMSRARRDKFGYDALFDPIIISALVGAVKPHPAIFDHAVALLGLQPAEILFVDNMPLNVEAALGQGWNAIRFEDAAQLEAALARIALL